MTSTTADKSKDPSPRTAELWGVWDSKTQAFHAGQEYRSCNNINTDFSLDTNALGTPSCGITAALAALKEMEHYPPCDFEPALTHLSEFLWKDDAKRADCNKQRLLLGNGASEMIDLITRCRPNPGSWKPGPYPAQYQELQRAALACGCKAMKADDPRATLLCLVNPNSPTGDYMSVETIKQYIEQNCGDDTTVIVDETSQPWLGPHWRDDSLISQEEWMENLATTRSIQVYVIHSWSKLWDCPGIRLGSLVAPTRAAYELVKSHQVPWSVNNPALEFLTAVIKDEDYLKKTWEVHREWRALSKKEIEDKFHWKVHGEDWVPWLWVDTEDEALALEVVQRCRAAGLPVRPGKIGYDMNTFFRLAIRRPEVQKLLFTALEPMIVAAVH